AVRRHSPQPSAPAARSPTRTRYSRRACGFRLVVDDRGIRFAVDRSLHDADPIPEGALHFILVVQLESPFALPVRQDELTLRRVLYPDALQQKIVRERPSVVPRRLIKLPKNIGRCDDVYIGRSNGAAEDLDVDLARAAIVAIYRRGRTGRSDPSRTPRQPGNDRNGENQSFRCHVVLPSFRDGTTWHASP